MQAPLKIMTVVPNGAFGVKAQPGTGLAGTDGIKRHIGTDLRASIGTAIYAPGDGRVIQIYIGSGGNKVMEVEIGSWWMRFLHLKDFDMEPGHTFKQGQLLGWTGNTGGVPAHLHWDVRKKGTIWSASLSNYVDPMKLIKGGQDMINKNQLLDLYVQFYGRGPTDTEKARYIGKTTYDKHRANMLASAKFAGLVNSASMGELNPVRHLPTPLKRAYVDPPIPGVTILPSGNYKVE